MNRNKIVISRSNATGSIRQFTNAGKTKGVADQFSDNALRKAYCSIDNDNITTYVQKKNWVTNLNDYLYPPYVECEYVM